MIAAARSGETSTRVEVHANDAPISLAEWAARMNAETRRLAGVSVVPEECREAGDFLSQLMTDEQAAACVAADLVLVQALGGRAPHDEYEGLSPSFAALCRAADEKRRQPPDPRLDRLRELMADDVSLDRAYAELSRPTGVASATLQAAEFLMRDSNPERLRRWLNKRSRAERIVILQHLAKRGRTRAA